MINANKYTVAAEHSLMEALHKLEELSHENAMGLFVVDITRKLIGSVTSGDVRRALIRGVGLNEPITLAMNPEFTWLDEHCFDIEKLRFVKKMQLKIVPVLNTEGQLVKILNFQTKKSYLPIDAVLMAGGKGERLRPMTITTPKPLLEVGGRPIVDYNIDNLLSCGVEHISVTTNYLAEQLDQHFKYPKQGVQIECVREPKFLGTMGAVQFVPSFHNDTVLVMNSDLFTNIDLEDFFLHFKEHDADMSIAAVPYSVSVPYGIFELDGTRNIKGVHEKPSYHYYANAGIYLLKRSVLDLIPKGQFFNATDLMELLIAQGKQVIRFPLSGYWIDIGKPEDFKKAQDLAQHISKK